MQNRDGEGAAKASHPCSHLRVKAGAIPRAGAVRLSAGEDWRRGEYWGCCGVGIGSLRSGDMEKGSSCPWSSSDVTSAAHTNSSVRFLRAHAA